MKSGISLKFSRLFYGILLISIFGINFSLKAQSFVFVDTLYIGLNPEQWPLSVCNSVDWGDYDGDGDLDILNTGHSGYTNITRIFRNDGNGVFTGLTSLNLPGIDSGEEGWMDFDNDGDLDILLTGVDNPGHLLVKILKNDGPDIYSEVTILSSTNFQWPFTRPSVDADWGDYDKDGFMDLLVVGDSISSSDQLYPFSVIYRNNGDGTFSLQSQIVLPGVYHGSARWQDFDNDGSLDFLLCGATGNPYHEQPVTKVFRNDGSGSFTQVADLAGVYYGEAVWCDINNDGFPDIIESGSSGNDLNREITSNVYKNQGDGTFLQLSGHMLPPATGSSLGCGDYDNDGYMDILMIGSMDTNFYIPETKLYRNNGDGTFTPENDLAFPGLGYGDVAWADYNQDGFLDVLVAGANAYGGRNCMVYRSTGGTTPNTAPGGPENLQVNSDGDLIVFSWEEAFDEITPQPCLSYNLRIGTTPGGCEIMAPLSQPGGQTLIPCQGNMGTQNEFSIELPSGTYYWAVQTIDNGWMGSPFITDFFTTSVSEPTEARIHISPNPVTDFLKIEGLIPGTQIRILNSEGKIVKTGYSEGSTIIIQTKDLQKGLYFINFPGEDSQSIKFISL